MTQTSNNRRNNINRSFGLRKSILKAALNQTPKDNYENVKAVSSIRNSFDIGLERKLFIARNNLRLNACISAILLLA